MDYHSVHGHDVASFEISSSHRLPTVTASAAFEELQQSQSMHVSTGISELDKSLQHGSALGSQSSAFGGVKRGQVTEIWGPPGTGKTALGLQMAAYARCNEQPVVWIDCFQDVATERVARACEAIRHVQSQNSADGSRADGRPAPFYHYACLTLPHLITLVSRPIPRLIPKDTSLVILDNASALINSTLPRAPDGNMGNGMRRGPNPSVKRRQALQAIMKHLQTLASTKNCAVVLLSHCATKMQSERGATLTPAINANLWEQGISTRLVLYRDWDWVKGKARPVYLAGVQKLDGRSTNGAIELVSGFKISHDGISSVIYHAAHNGPASLPKVTVAQPTKRKLAQTKFEVPDSEDDEDYGWAEDDEAAMPPPPPQWQGSEDLILGQELGRSSDNECEEDEDEHEE